MRKVDAVVVGSGAGGAPVAHTLAQAGAEVLILEKGPRYSPKEFLHDEIDSCRRDFFVPFPSDDPHTLRRTPQDSAHRTSAGWISRCVGGGTVHMSGFFFRFHPRGLRPPHSLRRHRRKYSCGLAVRLRHSGPVLRQD